MRVGCHDGKSAAMVAQFAPVGYGGEMVTYVHAYGIRLRRNHSLERRRRTHSHLRVRGGDCRADRGARPCAHPAGTRQCRTELLARTIPDAPDAPGAGPARSLARLTEIPAYNAADARSRALSSAAVSSRVTEASSGPSWSTVRALARGATTPGRVSSQPSAIVASSTPRSAAISSIAASTATPPG